MLPRPLQRREALGFVIAGLDPAIHDEIHQLCSMGLDAR
jgi:hypothetical protein